MIIVLIAGPLSFLIHPKPAKAAWWNDSWQYRKSIQITNNTSAQNNVYVNVTIDTSDSTRFKSTCGDLRFTQVNGKTMPYLINSGCGTSSTVVSVAFDVFPAGAQTIYYYYGNPNAIDGFQKTTTGSVTQANMKLSIVNGTSFVDFSSANTLTMFHGNRLVITDSTATHNLTGYIGSAGTGETYGSELLSNSSFDSNTTGWIPSGCSLNSVAGGQTNNDLQLTRTSGTSQNFYSTVTATTGALYVESIYAKSGTSGNESARINYYEGGNSVQHNDVTTSSAWTMITGLYSSHSFHHIVFNASI